MSAITDLSPEQIEQEVSQSALPVLVDFYGYKCRACDRMLPVVEEIATENATRLKIVKVNAHDHLEFASRCKVNAVPNFVLFSKGAPIGQRVGLTSKSEMLKWIDDSLR